MSAPLAMLSAVTAAVASSRWSGGRPVTLPMKCLREAATSNGKATREAERTDREAERRQARAAEKRAKEATSVESSIAAKEAELAAMSAVMNDPDFYQSHPNPQSAFSNYARLKREVEGLYEKLERTGA